MFKQPITDAGKNSKKGRLSLEIEDGKYVTKEEGKGDPRKVRHVMGSKCHVHYTMLLIHI